jgi:hypothetical protein
MGTIWYLFVFCTCGYSSTYTRIIKACVLNPKSDTTIQTLKYLNTFYYVVGTLCYISVMNSYHIKGQWSEVKLFYNRRSVGQSVLVSGSHLEPMTRFLFSVWQLRVSWCVAPSLTRGWVYNLLVQLLLGLARAVTLGSKSRRTHDHILLSHLRLHQPGGPGPCIYIPQEQGGPVIPPGTGFPFVTSYDSQGCGGGILSRLHLSRLGSAYP